MPLPPYVRRPPAVRDLPERHVHVHDAKRGERDPGRGHEPAHHRDRRHRMRLVHVTFTVVACWRDGISQ
ncbi:hypothetical protein [Streptomyces sp. NPDC093970]|uniref:hypothetical protein n=1 Tax=Streptomyces sp. NPDC093970 TaxID=3155076 RepID=UPI00343434CE